MIKKIIAAFVLTVAFSVGVLSPVYAADCTTAKECAQIGVNSVQNPAGTTSVGELLKKISDVLLFVLGGVAVIMIIIGGIKYVTSQGETAAVTSAKNTILYSVIGLLVAIFAYAIVHFVIANFVK